MILFGGRNNDHFALGDCYKLSLTNLQWHKVCVYISYNLLFPCLHIYNIVFAMN